MMVLKREVRTQMTAKGVIKGAGDGDKQIDLRHVCEQFNQITYEVPLNYVMKACPKPYKVSFSGVENICRADDDE